MSETTNVQIDLEQDEKDSKGEWSIFKKNLLISVFLLIVVITFLIVSSICQPKNDPKHDYFDIQKICELTTLECRFHNVAATSDYKGLLGLQKELVWIEYDAIIELGIDVKKVKIYDPTKDGVVKIYLPPVEIHSQDYADTTISKPVYDVGPLGKFDGEDERVLAYAALKDLVADVQGNESILGCAHDNAKKILEEHVINMGKLSGKEYTIKWIEDTNE